MTKKNLLALAAGIVICLIAARFAISVTDKNHTYGDDRNHNAAVDNWITTPEYQTDASRAINAYERLMERYMDSMDERFSQLSVDSQAVSQQLSSINTKLDDLSLRMSRIEKALGIDPNASSSSKAKASKH